MARGPGMSTTAPQTKKAQKVRFERNGNGFSHGNPFVLGEDECADKEKINPPPCSTTGDDSEEAESIPVATLVQVNGRLVVHELAGIKSLGEKEKKWEIKYRPSATANSLMKSNLSQGSSRTSKNDTNPAEAIHGRISIIGTEGDVKGARKESKKSKAPRKQSVKRSRSAAQLPQAAEDESSQVVQSNPTNSFYIADIDALRSFYEVRLSELTLKPIRKILTEWVAFVTPKRRRFYGKYAKKVLPTQLPPGHCPPWWPDDVYYEEPSHLESAPLKKLGAQIMLLHCYKNPDTGEYRNNWIRDLRRSAEYSVITTPLGDFTSSSKMDKLGWSKYNSDMKERALQRILPDLFDTAQAYEDHVAFYELYDGRTSDDPASRQGKLHNWQLIARPERIVSMRGSFAENKRSRVDERDSRSTDTTEDGRPHQEQSMSRQSSHMSCVLETPTTPFSVQQNANVLTAPTPTPMDNLALLPNCIPSNQSMLPPTTGFSSMGTPTVPSTNGLPCLDYSEFPFSQNLRLIQEFNAGNLPYTGPRWVLNSHPYVSTPEESFNTHISPMYPSLPDASSSTNLEPGLHIQNTFAPTRNFHQPFTSSHNQLQFVDMSPSIDPSIDDCKVSFGSAMSFDSNVP